jgi:Peptide-N-glycosidase F, C terminal
MQINRILLVLLLAALLMAGAVLVGCDDDDDDDNDDNGGDVGVFCSRISQCSLGGEIGADDMAGCQEFFAENPEIVSCVLDAAGCDEAAACVGGDDDDDDTGDDDTGDDDTSGDDDTTPPEYNFSCEDLGLPVREFIDAAHDNSLYATAADFTVPTMKGDWNFQENFTGCETYLFIQDRPNQNQGWPVGVFERDVAGFLNALPANVQVFFVSTHTSEGDRLADLQLVIDQVDAFTEILPPEEAAQWYYRLHFVTERTRDLEGWLGEIFTSPRWGAGIDRFQRVRYIGSYADYTRYDAARSWFAPNLKMASNEPIYYNFEAEREAEMVAAGATEIEIFAGEVIEDPGWTGVRTYADFDLPDAATMATFDTLELDHYLGCVGDGEFGDCPAWDYINELYLCDPGNPDICNVEIGRWITTYHREGRWVHDVSGILPLLAGGGTHRVAYYSQQPYEVKLTMRLSSQAKAARPVESHFLFSGGAFGPEYNDQFDPIPVAIPADAVRVELATVISGHGMESPGNCAEFCNTTHYFVINGHEVVRDFPETESQRDCMDQVAEGTVPNQYGTWWYGRSGWCPGKEVPMVRIDVTEYVTPGEDAVFEYYAFFQGEPYPHNGPRIDLKAWAVISQ